MDHRGMMNWMMGGIFIWLVVGIILIILLVLVILKLINGNRSWELGKAE